MYGVPSALIEPEARMEMFLGATLLPVLPLSQAFPCTQ
jgi:hypothetical protein